MKEISILEHVSICLLAANVQTKIIPNIIKRFVLTRHSEPTLLVIVQADLLMGQLRFLLVCELNDQQG